MNKIEADVISMIAERCIGHIDAIGETEYDNASFENLKTQMAVIDIMLDDVQMLAPNAVSYEASVQKIGCRVIGYLAELRDSIDGWLKEAQERQLQKWSERDENQNHCCGF